MKIQITTYVQLCHILYNIHPSLNIVLYTHANLHKNDLTITLNVNVTLHIFGYNTKNVHVTPYIYFHIICNFSNIKFLHINELNEELIYSYCNSYYNTNTILNMDDHSCNYVNLNGLTLNCIFVYIRLFHINDYIYDFSKNINVLIPYHDQPYYHKSYPDIFYNSNHICDFISSKNVH